MAFGSKGSGIGPGALTAAEAGRGAGGALVACETRSGGLMETTMLSFSLIVASAYLRICRAPASMWLAGLPFSAITWS